MKAILQYKNKDIFDLKIDESTLNSVECWDADSFKKIELRSTKNYYPDFKDFYNLLKNLLNTSLNNDIRIVIERESKIYFTLINSSIVSISFDNLDFDNPPIDFITTLTIKFDSLQLEY